MFTVIMESDEFGREEFPRDTKREARATVARLKRKVKVLKDGIERRFTIELSGLDA